MRPGAYDMEFIETPAFTNRAASRLTDEELLSLQVGLSNRPDAGELILGSGGLRKIRIRGSGRGKRGGARVIYYWAVAKSQIILLDIYAKNERSDLTKDQIRSMKVVLDQFKK